MTQRFPEETEYGVVTSSSTTVLDHCGCYNVSSPQIGSICPSKQTANSFSISNKDYSYRYEKLDNALLKWLPFYNLAQH